MATGSEKKLNGSSSVEDVFEKFPSSKNGLSNSVAIITGANSGIGLEICRALASASCHVILACRSEESAKEAISGIRSQYSDAQLTYIHLDLSSLDSVKQFADHFISLGLSLDYLFLNAAVNGLSNTTDDGFESTFQINYLSHYYLTRLLRPTLHQSSRVIVVSSESHRQSLLSKSNLENPSKRLNFSSMFAYNDSKLMGILMANELDRKWKDSGIRVVSCHPGNMVFTNIQKYSYFLKTLYYLSYPFTKTPSQAAATVLYTAFIPLAPESQSQYYNNCQECSMSSSAKDGDLSAAVIEYSERLLAQRLPPL